MTTALREEVSHVRLFAHTLVIGRNKAGQGNSSGASLSSQWFAVRSSVCYDPIIAAEPYNVFKKARKK